jgi:hypothetical protein
MSDFFAKISGQFTGALLLSALFPVLLFLTAFALVVLPMTPYGGLARALEDAKYLAEHPGAALLVSVFILAASVVLFNLNIPIVRLYEGYPWKDSLIGRAMTALQRRRFEQVRRVRERLRWLRRHARKAGVHDALPDLGMVQGRLGLIMNAAYPISAEHILPTRLGNTIRAFETYPKRQYEIDAVPLWPRLQAVVPPDRAQALDGAKTAFDFMIHCSFLSALLGLATAAAGVYWRQVTAGPIAPGVAAPAFALLAYLFYSAALDRAGEWGLQVKTTFDLYRLTLLEKLGYKVAPANLSEERRMWEAITYSLLYPDHPAYAELPYAAPASQVVATPNGTVLHATRAVHPSGAKTVDVVVVIANVDPAAFAATAVELHEQIPEGMAYVPHTAIVDGGPAPFVRSLDPLVVDVGPLAHQASKRVTYRLETRP